MEGQKEQIWDVGVRVMGWVREVVIVVMVWIMGVLFSGRVVVWVLGSVGVGWVDMGSQVIVSWMHCSHGYFIIPVSGS